MSERDFEAFFRAEHRRLAQTIFLITGDRESARDICQEAFARAFARWRKVGRYERPDAWVRTVAIRLAYRGRRHAGTVGEAGSIVEPASDTDTRTAVRALPPQQRAVIVLHYFEDRPVKEIASILGCSESTAKVHLHRARKRLAELLREEVDDVVG